MYYYPEREGRMVFDQPQPWTKKPWFRTCYVSLAEWENKQKLIFPKFIPFWRTINFAKFNSTEKKSKKQKKKGKKDTSLGSNVRHPRFKIMPPLDCKKPYSKILEDRYTYGDIVTRNGSTYIRLLFDEPLGFNSTPMPKSLEEWRRAHRRKRGKGKRSK